MTPHAGGLRVAVTNPLHGQAFAESGLEARFLVAGMRLGWMVEACPEEDDVRSFDPDFVLSLHTSAPKQTDHMWYGCLWHPPAFFGGASEAEAVRQDGFLVASASVRRWLMGVLGPSAEHRILGEIQTSVNHGSYIPADLSEPRLLYAGVNWDGPRHKDLFAELADMAWLDVYGPSGAWGHLPSRYRGVLPFDGFSIIDALHRAGVGLCLHTEMHRHAGTPSLRLFETVAAGAVVIAEHHPFIEEFFSDCVLWIREDARPSQEIIRLMDWVRDHPAECEQMTRRAHQVLTERFTLERLLSKIASAHHRFVAEYLPPTPGARKT